MRPRAGSIHVPVSLAPSCVRSHALASRSRTKLLACWRLSVPSSGLGRVWAGRVGSRSSPSGGLGQRSRFDPAGGDVVGYRRALQARGIRRRIARGGTADGSWLGRQRWVVERTLAWLHQFKRLRIRWGYRADVHEAFPKLVCCPICWRRLQPASRLRSNVAVRPWHHTFQA